MKLYGCAEKLSLLVRRSEFVIRYSLFKVLFMAKSHKGLTND
jgi:hypothetical protein